MIFKFPFLIKGNPFDVPLGMQIVDAPLVENCEKHKFFAMFRKIVRVQLCGEREKETRVKIYLRTNVTRASAQTQTWNEGSDLVKKKQKTFISSGLLSSDEKVFLFKIESFSADFCFDCFPSDSVIFPSRLVQRNGEIENSKSDCSIFLAALQAHAAYIGHLCNFVEN